MTGIRMEDVAVTGFSGRFPGANTVEQFFENCCQGKDTIEHFSQSALESAGIKPALFNQPHYVRAKGIIEQPEYFDARFFGISDKEATLMDPQQRLFLLCAVEALEQAGLILDKSTPKTVGVFASTGISHYLIHHILKNETLMQNVDELQLLLGNDKDFLATRLSYYLNLQGPSLTIQTGCSSSLVNIHYAVQSLLNGECDMAVAGGVSLTIPQQQGYFYFKDMIGSPDGHCRAFDTEACGTVKSNGLGVVVLKPLAQAVADNDYIYAVIRGSAVNNDGSAKVGFTAPNANQQAAVIREALQMAEVDPAEIGYIETHGTGTLLGDPIEISALKKAFQLAHIKGQSCALTSLKTNVGHLDVAAGVASFIRACLAVNQAKIPPSLHFSTLNPAINLDNTCFYINTEMRAWPETAKSRCAGISAFGIGGTNAHVIIKQPPARVASIPTMAARIFPFSAKSSESLWRYLQVFRNFVEQSPAISLTDLAHTLTHARTAFCWRAVVIAENTAQLLEKLTLLCVSDLCQIDETADTKMLSTDAINLEMHAQLWLENRAILPSVDGYKIPLPGYCWDLKKYWIEADSISLPNPKTFAADDIKNSLQEAWKHTLGSIAQGDDNFFQQGGDSLLAIQFIQHLPASCQLTVVDLYQYPTMRKLIEFITRNQTDKKPLNNQKNHAETLIFIPGEEW